jgi:hypothetical protein
MFKPQRFMIPSAILVLAMTGCQQSSAPGNTTAAQSAQGAVQATSNSIVSVEPSSIASCDSGVTTTVNWNAQAAHVTTTATQIWVGPNATDLKLFSEGGSNGKTQTGPWTFPGTHFVLKNKTDGKVLADVTVGGPKCP